uniref:DNA-directed DNA polymerase n=1 Tax=Tanacetum cinerariifolium TaxID=118510 RepID=A0A6L2JXG2_TANCI|nr:DNA-directed DNA polymerase [Tanacetum cinerariifolium]
MHTRSKSYANNSNATIPRRSKRRRVPNIVEPEIHTIEEVVLMADRTMEELLQVPTEGYIEAIIIPELLAENFEIKTNLLQLVQTNKFHDFEMDNPHTHISNFKRMTSTLKYRGVPNDAIKLMLFPYSLEGAARICNQPSVCAATGTYNQVSWPKRACNQIPQPGFSPVQNNQNRTRCFKTQSKPNIPYPSRLNDQKLREKATNQMEKFFQIFHDLHFDISFADALLLMPKFGSTIKSLLKNKDKLFELAKVPLNENCSGMLLKKLPEKLKKLSLPELTPTRMTLELADKSITRPKGVAKDVFVKVGKFHFKADPKVPLILRRSFLRAGRALIDMYREEITLRVNDESLLNNDPFKLPPMDLKQEEETKAKSLIEEPSKLELKELPSHLEYAFLEETDKLPVIIAKDLIDVEKEALIKVLNLWVSLIHCVPKKGVMTVVANENNELIPTRVFSNPDRSPRPRKTTFTCPYGTFAYRRMPFGLCNAPGTFQRCMIAIFHDMIEKTMEVFMDDFLVLGDSFSSCLSNLDKMLKHYEDTNLVLNWERCHFMCKEGIVLGKKFSKSRIEVDRAKVIVIAKLPHPTTVKGVRSFLGHAGFYRRFIQDFSKIARPMTHLLEKETPFVFSNDCIDSFDTLKKKLTEAMILVVPVYTDHSALKYLLSKQDVKPRLLWWVLFLQEFDITICDKKGSENLAADHLSSLENPYKDVLENKDINENFPLETLGSLSSGSTLWTIPIFKRQKVHSQPVDYLSKWVEAKALPTNNARVVVKTAGDHRKLQLNELNELRDQAYENSLIYKEKTKKLHDSKIKNRIFNVGDQVILLNSCLKIFLGKLKTLWSGRFTITQVFLYGTVELSQPNGPNFKVNGHRVKHYFGGDIPSKVFLDLHTFPWTNKCGDRVKLCDSVTKNKALRGWNPMHIHFFLLSIFLLMSRVRLIFF